MAESALAGLAVMRFVAVVGGSTAMNTLHVRQATDVAHTEAGLNGLLAAGVTWFTSAGTKALYSSTCNLSYVEVADLSPTRWATRRTNTATSPTGTAGISAVTNSMVVTLDTGLQGRAFRGRWYTAYVPEDKVSVGGTSFDAAWAASWETQIEALFSGIASAAPVNYRAVLWHQFGYRSVPSDPTSIVGVDSVTNLTGASAKPNYTATQRRRTQNVGM